MRSPFPEAARRGRAYFAAALLLPASGALGACARSAPAPAPPPLRVCADPNNLPFSNERGEGFENRLMELVAADLETTVETTWWAQRRGFVRNTLRAGRCDVIPGIPTSSELVLATAPYYRSTYVFVAPEGRPLPESFDDPLLRDLLVGVQLVGDDYTNTPPAHALAKRGLVANVRGYPIYGDYRRESPPADILRALAGGEIDLAVVWGPLAGYWGQRQEVPLAMRPVAPQIDLPFLPFVYDIALGVRREDEALRARLDEALARRRDEVDALLAEYGVPRVDRPAGRGASM